jgi:hypothetical protein
MRRTSAGDARRARAVMHNTIAAGAQGAYSAAAYAGHYAPGSPAKERHGLFERSIPRGGERTMCVAGSMGEWFFLLCGVQIVAGCGTARRTIGEYGARPDPTRLII